MNMNWSNQPKFDRLIDTTAETLDEPDTTKESGVRRVLARAQEIIRGLAQGNGELRKENQALWSRTNALELQLKESRKVVSITPAGKIEANKAYMTLLRDYREVVRQRDQLMRERDTLRTDLTRAQNRYTELARTCDEHVRVRAAMTQERDDLARVVTMRRGFSKQYLATVDLDQRIKRAEDLHGRILFVGAMQEADLKDAPSFVRETNAAWVKPSHWCQRHPDCVSATPDVAHECPARTRNSRLVDA